jgi:hypothetical protein
MYSLAAEELLLGTACQESQLRYVVQLAGGPALGLFQMEPATHDDIWDNFMAYQPRVLQARIVRLKAQRMIGNLWYAAAMCRLHYYRVREPIPEVGDLDAQASYWKRHYNTHLGAGTVDEYKASWRGQVTP